MSFKINSLYLTDGYKVGHKAMLAPGTTRLYGTWIPRSVKHAPKGITKIVSFGQQLVWKWLHDEFEENFFRTKERPLLSRCTQGIPGRNCLEIAKEEALQFVKDMSLYLGMEYDGKHFEELWDLGYLPIKVKALPEGIETNPNIPHMTFVNTVDGFAWLTLYLETVVSALAWKPSTAATIAKLYRRQAEEWVAKTDNKNMWLVDFMCHDFSARGLDPMSQYLIGLGHATSFKGSDTLPVIPAARYFYGVKDDEMPIFSVNASEHSVSTTKIFTVGEQQMIADWLKIFPKGILSIVSDTFDLWKLITEYLPANKDAILRRGEYLITCDGVDWNENDELIPCVNEKEESYYLNKRTGIKYTQELIDRGIKEGFIKYTPGKLVIRPDSGDPVDIICGHYLPNKEVRDGLIERADNTEGLSSAPIKGVIELLWDIFGGTVNEQGYKVLDPHIGAIYDDSITPERQRQIYERLAAKGFAATNIILGVGSFTYQYNTRDTLGFAAKGAWFEVVEPNNEDDDELVIKTYNIYKDPVTDDGTKKSLKGLLRVGLDITGQPAVICECTPEQESGGLLQVQVIYEDGKFYNQTTLTEVRERLLCK